MECFRSNLLLHTGGEGSFCAIRRRGDTLVKCRDYHITNDVRGLCVDEDAMEVFVNGHREVFSVNIKSGVILDHWNVMRPHNAVIILGNVLAIGSSDDGYTFDRIVRLLPQGKVITVYEVPVVHCGGSTRCIAYGGGYLYALLSTGKSGDFEQYELVFWKCSLSEESTSIEFSEMQQQPNERLALLLKKCPKGFRNGGLLLRGGHGGASIMSWSSPDFGCWILDGARVTQVGGAVGALAVSADNLLWVTPDCCLCQSNGGRENSIKFAESEGLQFANIFATEDGVYVWCDKGIVHVSMSGHPKVFTDPVFMDHSHFETPWVLAVAVTFGRAEQIHRSMIMETFGGSIWQASSHKSTVAWLAKDGGVMVCRLTVGEFSWSSMARETNLSKTLLPAASTSDGPVSALAVTVVPGDQIIMLGSAVPSYSDSRRSEVFLAAQFFILSLSGTPALSWQPLNVEMPLGCRIIDPSVNANEKLLALMVRKENSAHEFIWYLFRRQTREEPFKLEHEAFGSHSTGFPNVLHCDEGDCACHASYWLTFYRRTSDKTWTSHTDSQLMSAIGSRGRVESQTSHPHGCGHHLFLGFEDGVIAMLYISVHQEELVCFTGAIATTPVQAMTYVDGCLWISRGGSLTRLQVWPWQTLGLILTVQQDSTWTDWGMSYVMPVISWLATMGSMVAVAGQMLSLVPKSARVLTPAVAKNLSFLSSLGLDEPTFEARFLCALAAVLILMAIMATQEAVEIHAFEMRNGAKLIYLFMSVFCMVICTVGLVPLVRELLRVLVCANIPPYMTCLSGAHWAFIVCSLLGIAFLFIIAQRVIDVDGKLSHIEVQLKCGLNPFKMLTSALDTSLDSKTSSEQRFKNRLHPLAAYNTCYSVVLVYGKVLLVFFNLFAGVAPLLVSVLSFVAVAVCICVGVRLKRFCNTVAICVQGALDWGNMCCFALGGIATVYAELPIWITLMIPLAVAIGFSVSWVFHRYPGLSSTSAYHDYKHLPDGPALCTSDPP